MLALSLLEPFFVRTVGAYHLGFTEDLAQVVSTLHTRFPHKRLYLCGFSLGGNVCLKLLGELGEEAEGRGVFGAVVTCVPYDPIGAQSKLDVGFSRAMYSTVRRLLVELADTTHTVFSLMVSSVLHS